MAAHSVELNDNNSIDTNLLSSRVPTIVTRHGDAVGTFYPARRPWTEADRIAFREDTQKIQLMMRDAGVTEDELMDDFKSLRVAEVKKPGQ